MLNISIVPLSELDFNNFYIIDIRGNMSFNAAHLKDSINLQNKSDIVKFIEAKQQKAILLLCFSANKAKSMALHLLKDENFVRSYKFSNVYYLECGIMEVFDSGFSAYFAESSQSADSASEVVDSVFVSDNFTKITYPPPPPILQAI